MMTLMLVLRKDEMRAEDDEYSSQPVFPHTFFGQLTSRCQRFLCFKIDKRTKKLLEIFLKICQNTKTISLIILLPMRVDIYFKFYCCTPSPHQAGTEWVIVSFISLLCLCHCYCGHTIIFRGLRNKFLSPYPYDRAGVE